MRIEVIAGPHRDGTHTFWKFWVADYHPGHPEGEHAKRERGQIFRANLNDHQRRACRIEGAQDDGLVVT